MGSRIAAHFANAGIPSDLLDITTDAAVKGIQTAIKQKPGAFFQDSSAALITPETTTTILTVSQKPTGSLRLSQKSWT